jgi:two-component system nitrate/nitrite response regulator NarL
MRDSQTEYNLYTITPTVEDHAPSLRVAELFMQILEQVGEPEHDPGLDGEDETVVLEFSINGVKYTLSRSAPQIPQPQVSLSPREKEIIRLVGKGLANKAIASVLEVSPWTVATHLRRVFTKLGVCSRAEMIAKVIGGGLLGAEELAGQ